MAGRIYLFTDDAELISMEEASYDSENLLQEMIANHPDLLAGDQINSEEPRRWLLVTREMSVPVEVEGIARWSLDHLFIDQDAIPTLVEVKRSSDSRIRREVVGQMLDYAANAVAYWPVEEIRAKFEGRCEKDGENPEETLTSLLGEDQSVDDFWQRVKTNLQAGRIRMVFLADAIPSELRRIVEFLNEQMDPAEVLAIEIRQFEGGRMKTLVPRVLGQSEAARQKKSSGARSAYRPIENKAATEFWIRYWEMVEELAPELRYARPTVKGSHSDWAHFRPDSLRTGIRLIHKLPQGYVDLQLDGMGGRLNEMQEFIGSVHHPQLVVEAAGKSGVLRLKVPAGDDKKPFDEQRQVAERGIKAAKTILEWYQDQTEFPWDRQ